MCACSHRDGEVGVDVTKQETHDKQESRQLSAFLEVPVMSLAAHEHEPLHTMRPEIEKNLVNPALAISKCQETPNISFCLKHVFVLY